MLLIDLGEATFVGNVLVAIFGANHNVAAFESGNNRRMAWENRKFTVFSRKGDNLRVSLVKNFVQCINGLNIS